ncbi:MAG: HAMP domain-containing protein [Methyloprofundus sp.]|nr:HAMP domain-containing protein [Methyloprofundus sp.]
MSRIKKPQALSLTTSLTLALGLVVYTALSMVLVFYFVLFPMATRAADDMAAFISVVADSWGHLNAQERIELTQHLAEDHQLFLRTDPVKLTSIKEFYPFIPRLEKSLLLHAKQPIVVQQDLEKASCFWVEIVKANQVLRFGFFHDRIGPKPPKAILGIIALAILLILIITMILVRRITSPIKKLSVAAEKLGHGHFSVRMPKTGLTELDSLGDSFNRMAEELAQLMSNRAILFGGVSHDLRTPITRMQLAAELLEDDLNAHLITGLRNDLNEMEHLIQQSMELVKGLDKKQPVATDVDQLFASIVLDYQRQNKQINWHLNESGICKIEAGTLRRVLINLLDNAFRYSEDQSVDLSCIKQGKNLIIRINDQGVGIPKEQLEAVFQPFFRLDSSRNKKTGGSGLGLAIVRQLCDAQEWKVGLFPGKVNGLEACLIIPTS